MRRAPLAAWLVVCVFTAACAGPGDAAPGTSSASCAAPYVVTEPRQAQPGDSLTIRGEGYVDGCDDTVEAQRVDALSDLHVTFDQDGEITETGVVDASCPGGVVLTTITVPADARAGLAEVAVGPGEPALVMVGDGRGGYPPWPGPPAEPSR